MKSRTKQVTTVLTELLQKTRWTARTAVKTALQILQKMHHAIKHPMNTKENRKIIPTDINQKTD